jgi:hypothetical protein
VPAHKNTSREAAMPARMIFMVVLLMRRACRRDVVGAITPTRCR